VRKRGRAYAALLVLATAACTKQDPVPAPAPASAASTNGSAAASVGAATPPRDRFSPEGMLAEATLYIDDPAFRRSALTESLTNPTNTYSRQRLENYALVTKGWDLLPEWNPQSIPVTTTTAAELREGKMPVVDPQTPRLWNGKRPATIAEWVALGREVFVGYPLRSEIFLHHALTHPELAKRVGVEAAADGVYPGVRAFVDVQGRSTIGITCAVCHANVGKNGQTIAGEAHRRFDYGALRLDYHATTKTAVNPDLARRMKTWGPGRADVTEDDDEDPVAIPDLWGLRHQTFLTQAGTIKHVGPTALAIRQETQLLHASHHKIRPPRVLAYALAMYLYALEPPPPAAAPAPPESVARGEALFGEHCATCHSNAARGGPLVSVKTVATDHALADGTARGTGKYRPPALVRVANAAPYFHQGAVPSLEDVLSPDRLLATYSRSPLAKGAVPGHAYGTDLPKVDRSALLAWLSTL
jgi:mono/diheme cytochrome c family protein